MTFIPPFKIYILINLTDYEYYDYKNLKCILIEGMILKRAFSSVKVVLSKICLKDDKPS